MKLASLKPLLSAHYILNPVACLLYVILKTFQPFCVWLFPDDECQMSWVSKVVQYFASNKKTYEVFLFYWYLHKIERELRVKISKNFTLHSKKNVSSKDGSFMSDETYDGFFSWFMSRFLEKENITMPTNLCDMFLLPLTVARNDVWTLKMIGAFDLALYVLDT